MSIFHNNPQPKGIPSLGLTTSWPHLGTIGKWHVDLCGPGYVSHHHSPTLYPPPRDEHGHIMAKELPPPYGRMPK